jgi:hypothetical protein
VPKVQVNQTNKAKLTITLLNFKLILGSIGNKSYHDNYDTNDSSLSKLELAILRSTIPINISETQEINVNGQQGIWANREEVMNWKGSMPIEDYQINEDDNPHIITKRSEQEICYTQELGIRYLRPHTPPKPGDIVIKQEVYIFNFY